MFFTQASERYSLLGYPSLFSRAIPACEPAQFLLRVGTYTIVTRSGDTIRSPRYPPSRPLARPDRKFRYPLKRETARNRSHHHHPESRSVNKGGSNFHFSIFIHVHGFPIPDRIRFGVFRSDPLPENPSRCRARCGVTVRVMEGLKDGVHHPRGPIRFFSTWSDRVSRDLFHAIIKIYKMVRTCHVLMVMDHHQE